VEFRYNYAKIIQTIAYFSKLPTIIGFLRKPQQMLKMLLNANKQHFYSLSKYKLYGREK